MVKKEKGCWTTKKLRKQVSPTRRKKESDICECGHPKYMHYRPTLSERHLQCKVHGCRHNLSPCRRFRKKKEVSLPSSHD